MTAVSDPDALSLMWHFEWWRTGSCRVAGVLAHLQASWRPVPFPAYAAFLERSQHRVMFDTGYAPRFHDCCARGLARVHGWATPVTIPRGAHVQARLRGRQPQDVLLSHWHADHTGGLLDLPEARVWRPHASHDRLRSRLDSPVAPLRGLLLGQVPPDLLGHPGGPLPTRLIDTASPPLLELPLGRWPFLSALSGCCRDAFGDGSLALVDLPGHALGHFGALFATRIGATPSLVLLCGDAVWDERELSERWSWGPAACVAFESWSNARETTERLREVLAAAARCGMADAFHVLPSHCERSAAKLARAGGLVS